MIHNIIHISDIHIRTGDSNKSRYDEYISVFDNLYESLSHQPSIINNTAIIAITGDIFHDKNKIGPSGIKVAIYLLQKLSSLAQVVIIRGNHDYRQDYPLEHDMISALIAYDIPNVSYLDTTGIHTFQNISFGLTAIQETLLFGSTSGINNILPDFPITTTDNYKIALFHGTINGCILQNGLDSTRNGYPIEWFKGYDAILLGDIHLQQVRRANIINNEVCNIPHTSICQTYSYEGQIPWGYSGSLIQQDFGETIKGHGYILWNLQNKTINVYHIKNKYGMIKLHFNGDVDNIMVEHKQFIKPITKLAPLDKVISLKWFPDILQIRVIGNNITQNDLDNISIKIKSFGKCIKSITKKIVSQITITPTKYTQDTSEVQNINSIDSLIQFIQDRVSSESVKLSSDKWKDWLIHPESLKYDYNCIPNNINLKLTKKLENLDKSIEYFKSEFDKIQSLQQISGNLSLNKLEWNWILNYKESNVFDFQTHSKCISVLNSKNGNGKSNFLEIICIALFGEGFPSRHNSKYSSNIICNKKPDGVMASTSITFTLNSIVYGIERTMRNNTVKRNIKFDNVILYKINNNTKEIIHQKDTAVSKWIEINIGCISSYLMSTMLTQNADSDFFSLDISKQKDLLDNVLSLNHINALKTLLKDSITYYKNTIELLEAYIDGIKSNNVIVDNTCIAELHKYKSELTLIIQDKSDLFVKWNTISHYELSKYDDINALKNTIDILYEHIQSFSPATTDQIQSRIHQLENKIHSDTSELLQFHTFSDLINSDLINSEFVNSENKDDEYSFNNDIRNFISHQLVSLQQHPFFKNTEYDIYENIAIIKSRIRSEYENQINQIEDVSDLIKLIHNFDAWDNLHTSKFAKDELYLQDDSQLQLLQTQIDELISELKTYPDRILKITKTSEKLRRQFNKLVKEKDSCMDKKPNKPLKTIEWLHTVESDILQFGDISDYEHTKDFIMNSIQQIPSVCTKIAGCIQKISEYQEYIQDCSNYPFNPDCNACKLQPWRTKYDLYCIELPNLQTQYKSLCSELDSLKYDDVTGELQYNTYANYIVSLKRSLIEINSQISDIHCYNSEKQLWSHWNEWNDAYNTIKNKYDTIFSEINDIESNKKHIESEFEMKRSQKQQLQSRYEIIRDKKTEYTNYISERQSRLDEYVLAKNNLEHCWFSTLYKYRVAISKHINSLKLSIESSNKQLISEKNALEQSIQRDKCLSEYTELQSVYYAYPFWIKWKQLDELETTLTSKIKELEIINASIVIDDNLLECSKVIQYIRADYDDIIYISQAFDGYREWMYTTVIGPLIQKRVNEILETMCDERPLSLECEWLDVVNTLSWFIRDYDSKVIIQKASGFQRFIVGIAMRVAINQIGLNKMRFNEFFIDEGFTSCDVDNLERVPEFLRGLLNHFGIIYLVTHLEDLKLCADNHIFIKRDTSGLSQIQYGDIDSIKQAEDSFKTPKKGRPTKNSIVVTKV